MSSVIKRTIVVVGVLLASAVAAQAETLEVKIPFAFVIGEQTMPAGEYRIERDATMPSSVVLIRGEHGNTATLFVQTVELTGEKPAGVKSALVFVSDEAGMRLTQVWGTAKIGQEILSSHRS
jgi:hypothetical protein